MARAEKKGNERKIINLPFFLCLKVKGSNMIKDLVEIIKNVSLRHKLVKTFRYQNDTWNNAQNNYKTYQVYLDTVSMHQLNITTNIFTSSFEIYILSQPNGESGNTVEDVQTYAFTIAVDILAALDNWEEFRGILSIYDYSLLTLSEYSDDNSSGVKLSVVLQVPSPLNLCEYEDHFNDEPYPQDEDKEIDVPTKEVGELTINPIKLNRNRIC